MIRRIQALMLRAGGAEITSDHVSLLRLVYAEWISVLFCVFPFCWGSVHSLCAQPWRPDKNCSSSSVHVNQGGGRGGERYNEIMKCVGPFFFFQDRPLGCNIFRHNKAIAGGVQSLWLSYGGFSTCQCATACLRAQKTHAGQECRPLPPSRQCQLVLSGMLQMDVPRHGHFSP